MRLHHSVAPEVWLSITAGHKFSNFKFSSWARGIIFKLSCGSSFLRSDMYPCHQVKFYWFADAEHTLYLHIRFTGLVNVKVTTKFSVYTLLFCNLLFFYMNTHFEGNAYWLSWWDLEPAFVAVSNSTSVCFLFIANACTHGVTVIFFTIMHYSLKLPLAPHWHHIITVS